MTTIINALPGAVAQGLIWGVMAIGLFISYKILDFADLTVDGSICTGACVLVVLVAAGVNVYLAMLLSFIAGLLTGLITAVFHTFMGIPPILSGILTQLILWSVNLKVLGKANEALPSRNYDLIISSRDNFAAIIVLLIITALLIGVLYWFFGTERGSSIRATGCNENMARAQGINVKANKIIALMLSNGIVALSGALLAQYQGFADINMGRGAIVIGLAAIIIGVSVFAKFKNFALKLSSVAIGGVIYYLVYQVVIALGLDTDLLKMLSAIVVAIFLAVPYWKKQWFSKRKLKGEKTNA